MRAPNRTKGNGLRARGDLSVGVGGIRSPKTCKRCVHAEAKRGKKQSWQEGKGQKRISARLDALRICTIDNLRDTKTKQQGVKGKRKMGASPSGWYLGGAVSFERIHKERRVSMEELG